MKYSVFIVLKFKEIDCISFGTGCFLHSWGGSFSRSFLWRRITQNIQKCYSLDYSFDLGTHEERLERVQSKRQWFYFLNWPTSCRKWVSCTVVETSMCKAQKLTSFTWWRVCKECVCFFFFSLTRTFWDLKISTTQNNNRKIKSKSQFNRNISQNQIHL